MTKLTRIEQKICDCISETVERKGYPPSVREIADAVGLKSPSTVHFHLKKMEAAGVIEKDRGKGRAVFVRGSRTPEEGKAPQNRIPVVGDVAAGNPILAQEVIEDYLTFDTGGTGGEYFALRVRGESMLNAGILPGDLVVVRRQQSADSGQIVVAMIENEATVKRLSLRGGQVWLLPENEDYSPINGKDAQILGRVTAVVRRY